MGSSGGDNPGMAPQGGRFGSRVPIAGQGERFGGGAGNNYEGPGGGGGWFDAGAGGGGGGDSGAMRQQLATLQSGGGNEQFGAARDGSGGGGGSAEDYAQQHQARYGSRPELTNPAYAELLRQSGDFRGPIRPTLPAPGG